MNASRMLLVLWALFAMAFACRTASAQTLETSALDAAVEQQVRQMAITATNAALKDPALGVSRVDISVGSLDKRLRLAPCQRIEPY